MGPASFWERASRRGGTNDERNIVYRMKSLPVRPKKNVPSVHDYYICRTLTANLLQLLDTAREEIHSPMVNETIFHIRGFIFEEMEACIDFVRPRE